MMVKFATVEVPLFDHLDLGITRSWRGIELDEMTEDQIAALRTYTVSPRIVQVHPEDAEAFAAYGSDGAGAGGADGGAGGGAGDKKPGKRTSKKQDA